MDDKHDTDLKLSDIASHSQKIYKCLHSKIGYISYFGVQWWFNLSLSEHIMSRPLPFVIIRHLHQQQK